MQLLNANTATALAWGKCSKWHGEIEFYVCSHPGLSRFGAILCTSTVKISTLNVQPTRITSTRANENVRVPRARRYIIQVTSHSLARCCRYSTILLKSSLHLIVLHIDRRRATEADRVPGCECTRHASHEGGSTKGLWDRPHCRRPRAKLRSEARQAWKNKAI